MTLRSGLASIDFSTGRVTSWNPDVSVSGGLGVNAIVMANDKIIAGGSFTNVGATNLSIPYLAAFDTLTGLPIQSPNWQGSAGGTVHALLVTGNRLYIAGDFYGLDGTSRDYLGVVDKNVGTLYPWHPIFDNGGVWSLASSGSKVFASGFFNHVNGITRSYAAAFDTTNDTLTAWDPEPGYLCFSMATLGDKVYLGGGFYGIGGNSSIKSLAAVDTATGALIPGFNANFYLALTVYAMAAVDTELIIGGQMSSSYSPYRSALAYLSANTGAVSSFNSHMNLDVGTATVYAIGLGYHTLVVGGQFLNLNYFPQANLAAFGDNSIDVGPKLKIVPDTLATGYVIVGTYKDTTVTLENVGTAPLYITNAVSTKATYSARPTVVTIQPGQSVIDTIRFTPTTVDEENALILYTSNSPTNPDTLWVSGRIEAPLSVEVTSFAATPGVGEVALSWKTQSEIDVAGFNVLREEPGQPGFVLISSYLSNDKLRGLGTSPTGRTYGFTDAKVVSGKKYQYKLQSVSTDGSTENLNTVSATVGVPASYALYQNYPNPFNPTTTIRFDLKEASIVVLDLYNVLGQKLVENNYGTMNAGRYEEAINMDAFSSGVYYYRVAAVGIDGEKFVSIKKLVLMK